MEIMPFHNVESRRSQWRQSSVELLNCRRVSSSSTEKTRMKANNEIHHWAGFSTLSQRAQRAHRGVLHSFFFIKYFPPICMTHIPNYSREEKKMSRNDCDTQQESSSFISRSDAALSITFWSHCIQNIPSFFFNEKSENKHGIGAWRWQSSGADEAVGWGGKKSEKEWSILTARTPTACEWIKVELF